MKRRENLLLSERETELLKAQCETFTDQLIVYGLLYTGMRVDELSHMKPSWIDDDFQSIRIPKYDDEWIPARLKEGVTQWHPKTIKKHCSARRVMILNPALIEILKYFVAKNYTLHKTPKEVYDRLQYLWRKTGSQDSISPHMLRHTALSRLVHQGFSIDSVGQQAGHRDGTTTLNTYVHPDNIEFERRLKEKGGIQ